MHTTDDEKRVSSKPIERSKKKLGQSLTEVSEDNSKSSATCAATLRSVSACLLSPSNSACMASSRSTRSFTRVAVALLAAVFDSDISKVVVSSVLIRLVISGIISPVTSASCSVAFAKAPCTSVFNFSIVF